MKINSNINEKNKTMRVGTRWITGISRVTSTGKIIYKLEYAKMMDFPYRQEKDL